MFRSRYRVINTVGREPQTQRDGQKEPEQRFRPPPCELEDRDAIVERLRYSFSEGCELAAEVAAKLEKVEYLPITHERGMDLIA